MAFTSIFDQFYCGPHGGLGIGAKVSDGLDYDRFLD